MDFFSHQDQARKRTGQLVALFFLAVITLIVLLNLLVATVLWYGDEQFIGQYQNVVNLANDPTTGMPTASAILDYVTIEQWSLITLGVLVVIGAASLFKWLALKGGGKSVAESLGGRLLNPDSNNFYEKRLLNVVEEMAIASGMPVPPVYVLPDNSINAFAAGYQPSDAVVGVTKGCMEQLTRDQLQGVIAHEFSHIFNGDMRLNIRLMAILFGILFIGMIGRFLFEAAFHGGRHRSSNDKNNPLPLIAIGGCLMVIGYCGVFFGNLIKSAVSRQREFLADASAVQFTRNPDSIGGALKVIGYGAGSEIESPERDETSHLFFGQALPFRFGWFQTHPPIDERIQRVDKHWNGQYLAPQTRQQAEQESPQFVSASNSNATITDTDKLTAVAATVAAAASLTEKAPIDYQAPETQAPETQTTETADIARQALQKLTDAAHETYSARALLFVLLLAPKERLVHDQQLDMIRQTHGTDLFKTVLRFIPLSAQLNTKERLPLVEKAFPALKQLSAAQYQEFRTTIVQLAKADGEIDIFEWCLYRLVLRYLEPTFSEVKPIKAKYNKAEKLSSEIATVLSYLAHYGHDSQPAAEAAFNSAIDAAGFDSTKVSLQPHNTSLKPLNLALAKLTEAYPHVKGRIIKALAACVQADDQLRSIELDIVRTIAAILESPVPGLFDDAGTH